MTPAAVLPAHHGQVCPCGAPAVYGLLWRQSPGSRPALRHALACARCAPPEAASWAPPAVALDPLPPSAGPTRPPPVDLSSSSGEGEATERSAAPVEAQTEPPAVAVAGSEVGRGLPALEPLAAAGGQPISTPDPWDGPEGRAHSEPQEAPVARAAATLPPVDPSAPPDRCRLQGCETPRFSRGLCRRHEGQVRRRGQIDLYGLPPVDPREAILRAQAARRKPAATESAPTPRPKRTPRARQAGPLPEEATKTGTEIREIDPQERDRYAAAEARIASLSTEAIQLRARVEELEISRAAVLREPEDAYRISELRRALAEIVDQDLDGQTDADLIAAATSEVTRLQGLVEAMGRGNQELRRLQEIGERLSDEIWRKARIQGGVVELVPRLLDGLTQIGLALGVPEGEGLEAILAAARQRSDLEKDSDYPSLSRGSVAFLAGFLGLPEGATSNEVMQEIARLQEDSSSAIRALSAAVLDPAQEWGGQPYTDDHATLSQAVAVAVATLESARARRVAVTLTAEELKARAAWLQEAEKLRGWLVGDIAVSVCADGDWRDIGGDWLFAAVAAALQARADELERQALEGVSRG